MKRTEEFLNEDNIEETKAILNINKDVSKLNRYIKIKDDEKCALIIENTDFGINGKNKNDDKKLLKNINMKVKKRNIN